MDSTQGRFQNKFYSVAPSHWDYSTRDPLFFSMVCNISPNISIWKRISVLELFIPYIQKDVLNADSGLDLWKIAAFDIKAFNYK